MTVDGVATKTLFLLGCLFVGAWLGSLFPHAALTARVLQPVTPRALYVPLAVAFFWPGLFAVTLAIVGFFAWHSERAQVYLAPAFAVVEGMCLASLALASNPQFPGLGLMALAATVALLLLVAGAYWFGLVSDLSPLALGVAAVMVTLAAGFGVILALRSLGADISLTGHATLVYWAIVCGYVVYLAQQLALSFRYIEEAAEMEAPQWMEWRAAFGLMVTLVRIFLVLFLVLRQVRATVRAART